MAAVVVHTEHRSRGMARWERYRNTAGANLQQKPFKWEAGAILTTRRSYPVDQVCFHRGVATSSLQRFPLTPSTLAGEALLSGLWVYSSLFTFYFTFSSCVSIRFTFLKYYFLLNGLVYIYLIKILLSIWYLRSLFFVAPDHVFSLVVGLKFSDWAHAVDAFFVFVERKPK